MTEGGNGATALLCSIGARFCALPIEHVVETMRPLVIEPMSGAPRVVRGVAIVRGAPLPVIDASILLGGHALATCERFVTMRVEQRQFVLAVEAVLGVRRFAMAQLHELPLLLSGSSADVIASVGALDAQLLVVLHALRLVPEPVWERLEKADRKEPEAAKATAS